MALAAAAVAARLTAAGVLRDRRSLQQRRCLVDHVPAETHKSLELQSRQALGQRDSALGVLAEHVGRVKERQKLVMRMPTMVAV